MFVETTVSAQTPVFQSITVENGLPSNYVTAIFFDRNNYLWVGTDKGLVRLNGSASKIITTDEGLGGNLINLIFQDSKGKIWVGAHEAGLSKLQVRFGQIEVEGQTAKGMNLLQMTQDSSQYYWIKAQLNDKPNQPVALYRTLDLEKTWQKVAELSHENQLDIDVYGNLYYSTADPIQWSTDTSLNIKKVALDSWVNQVIVSNGKMLLYGKKSIQVCKTERNKITLLYQDQSAQPLALSLRFVSSGVKDILVKTGIGDILYHNGKKDNLLFSPAYKQFFQHDRAQSDAYGNFFLSSFGEGITVLNENYLTQYNLEGAPKRIKASGEKVWVNSQQALLTIDTYSGSKQLLKYSELPELSFVFASKTGLPIAVGNTTFDIKSSSLTKALPKSFTDFSDAINSGDSYFISSYSSGVAKVTNNVYDKAWAQNLSLTSLCIERLKIIRNKLYASTLSKGVFVIDPQTGETKVIDQSKGLLSNAVYDVYEDDEALMIGTRNGLTLFRQDSVTKVGFDRGFKGTKVLSIFKDQQGRKWVVSEHFLHLLVHDTLYPMQGYPFAFGNTTPLQAAVFQYQTNRLWVLSADRIMAMDISRVMPPKVTAALDIDYILSGTESFPAWEKGISLENNHQPLTIQFKGPLYSVFTQPHVFAKLEGFDNEWKVLDDNFQITYPKLPAGTYTLILKGTGPFSAADQVKQLFTVSVMPPWWRKQTFLIPSCILLSLGIFLLTRFIYSRRYRKKLKQIEAEQALHLERLRIGRELHDNVGSMLTLIINKAEDLPVDAEQPERDIAFIARKTMTQLRDTIWALDKEKMTTGLWAFHAVDYKQCFSDFGPNIDMDFTWNEHLQLSPLNALHSFRILQESISNAIKHAGANTIRVIGSSDNNIITLVIRDDGNGFDENKIKRGYGLKNMQRRAEEMKAIIAINSDGGKGTSISLQWEAG